jgi:hypothetical protein
MFFFWSVGRDKFDHIGATSSCARCKSPSAECIDSYEITVDQAIWIVDDESGGSDYVAFGVRVRNCIKLDLCGS